MLGVLETRLASGAKLAFVHLVLMFAKCFSCNPDWGIFGDTLGKGNYDGFVEPHMFEHSTDELGAHHDL